MKDSVHFPCEEVNEIARYLFTPAADEAHVAAVIFNSKGHRYGTRPTASRHGKYKDFRTRGSGGDWRPRGVSSPQLSFFNVHLLDDLW